MSHLKVLNESDRICISEGRMPTVREGLGVGWGPSLKVGQCLEGDWCWARTLPGGTGRGQQETRLTHMAELAVPIAGLGVTHE